MAAVAPATLNPEGDTAVVTVIPTTGPQDPETVDLVNTLRDDVLPSATDGTGVTVHVGGVTATSIDSTDNIAKRLPLLIGGVVLLSMLLLVVSFRSIAVAVKAAVMNLLSVAAAYGVVALVLQGGWAGQLIGIDTPTPLPAFVPVLMFAVLFGLSMDYEVFLVSRMREGWLRTRNNEQAILGGLAGTGRVITAAAAIMVAVFAAFIPSPDVVLKVIGVGMAAAILIDATVVRLLLVPAVMHMLGRANWWMPAWLGRILPELHVEGHPEDHLRRGLTRPHRLRAPAEDVAGPQTNRSAARAAGGRRPWRHARHGGGRRHPPPRPATTRSAAGRPGARATARLLSYQGPRVSRQRSGERGTLPPSSRPVGRARPLAASLIARLHHAGQRVADRRARRLHDDAVEGDAERGVGPRLGDVAVVDVAGEERDRPRRPPAPPARDVDDHLGHLDEAALEGRPVLEVGVLPEDLADLAAEPAPRALGQRLAEGLDVVQPGAHQQRQRGTDQQVVDVAAHPLVEPGHLVVVEHRALVGLEHARGS